MPTFYELWDVETRNSLGTYPTEQAALGVVRQLIEAYGDSYADLLELGYDDEAGGDRIATGATLAKRARGSTAASPLVGASARSE